MNFLDGKIQNGAFTVGDLIIPLTEYDFVSSNVVDGLTTMGIRPEHVLTGDLVDNAPIRVNVDVELIEPTGSDKLIDCQLAGHHFRVRMDGQAKVSIGEKLRLGIDPARASLFDAATELRL